MTLASEVLASDDVSSGALLQTISSVAVLQTHSSDAFKLQMNSFALDFAQSESL